LAALQAPAHQAAAIWRRAARRSGRARDSRGRKVDPEAMAFAAAEERCATWRKHLDKLPSYVAVLAAPSGVSRRNLGEWPRWAMTGGSAPERLPLILEQTWARTLLDRAMRERPELREFDATTHEQVIQRFRKADEATFSVNRARLAELHWSSLPGPVAYGQVGTLRREAGKKTRHLPIRGSWNRRARRSRPRSRCS
jgi:hypothetical protein